MLHKIKRGFRDWQRANFFRDLVEAGEDALASDKNAVRTVILVRDDILPPIHQGIQAMHAVIELEERLLRDRGKLIDPRCYLILLGASNEQMETYAVKIWKKYGKTCGAFKDPGLVDPHTGEPPITAVAFEPMTAEEVRIGFGGLKRAK